jgi:hypothetical protein
VRTGLKNKETTPALLDQLFWFMAAQYIRTHSFMNHVAKMLSLQQAQRKQISFEGRMVTGMFVGMADTGEVMNHVTRFWPFARQRLESDYDWTVFHNSRSRKLLTSDDPCQWNSATGGVIVPIDLDLALVGRIVQNGQQPRFRHAIASPELVAEVNRAIVKGCNSCVYGHTDTPDLRRFMEKNYVKRDIMLAGRGFSNNGKPIEPEEIERLMKNLERLRAKERERETGVS